MLLSNVIGASNKIMKILLKHFRIYFYLTFNRRKNLLSFLKFIRRKNSLEIFPSSPREKGRKGNFKYLVQDQHAGMSRAGGKWRKSHRKKKTLHHLHKFAHILFSFSLTHPSWWCSLFIEFYFLHNGFLISLKRFEWIMEMI